LGSHTYSQNGEYTVTVVVTDSQSSTGQDTFVITVNDTTPTAALTGDTSLDEGEEGIYNAGGSTGYDTPLSYQWDFNYDGTTFNPGGDTGATGSHTWNANGNYIVAVRVTDADGSTDIETIDVTVGDLGPGAQFNWTPEPQAEGSVVTFTDTSTSSPDTITGWSWDFGDGNTSTDQNPDQWFNRQYQSDSNNYQCGSDSKCG